MATNEERLKKLRRYAKVRAVSMKTGSRTTKAMQGALRKTARRLASSREFGRVQIEVMKGSRVRAWSLALAGSRCEVVPGGVERPDFSLRVSEESFWQMARGQISPIEVFLRGQMLTRGDCRLAKRLFVKLAGKGSTEI